MEESVSKHNDPLNYTHNEEAKLLKELQGLMSSSIPTDLLLSILQSQMLAHSNCDIHQSISHLLILYPGKRGKIGQVNYF